MILHNDFFKKDVVMLAKSLIGKVLCRKIDTVTLKARIIETEAYSKSEPASHSSLGWSLSRAAMFMDAGTIYMYHSRAGASFNISALGAGDAVLVKSAVCFLDNDKDTLYFMQQINKKNDKLRDIYYLASGQTLLCKSLMIDRVLWDKKQFNNKLYIEYTGYIPENIVITSRLGIPKDRDNLLLPYRYIDKKYIKYATKGRCKFY
ncbi:MAG: DNA-3-methyladenine glycosylase [Mucispirillum sp.]|nr:DNA-3-methyladenine glycosylase [Mucispirillum sp.]